MKLSVNNVVIIPEIENLIEVIIPHVKTGNKLTNEMLEQAVIGLLKLDEVVSERLDRSNTNGISSEEYYFANNTVKEYNCVFADNGYELLATLHCANHLWHLEYWESYPNYYRPIEEHQLDVDMLVNNIRKKYSIPVMTVPITILNILAQGLIGKTIKVYKFNNMDISVPSEPDKIGTRWSMETLQEFWGNAKFKPFKVVGVTDYIPTPEGYAALILENEFVVDIHFDTTIEFIN